MLHFTGIVAWKSSQEKVVKCLLAGRMVWESSLGEQSGRAAWEEWLMLKIRWKNLFSVWKNLGEYNGRVVWESNLGEQYRREALDYWYEHEK